MENTDPQKGSANSLSLRARFFRASGERFGLEKAGFVLIFLAAVLVGVWVMARGNRWVMVRGNSAHDSLLGRPLRVGIVSWPGYAGGLVANSGLKPDKDSDFWKNNNRLLVDFEVIDDEGELRRRFELGGDQGGIDVMWSTVDSLAQQAPEFARKGVHPRAFMQVDWSRGGDAIVARGDIRRIEDLKGKTVAVSMSASQWLFENSLANSSLTEEEKIAIQQTRMTTGGSPEAREKFVGGKAEAAVLWEPDVSEALKLKTKDGAHILVDSSTAANLIADVMVAKQEFIRQNPDVIKAFIRGWFEGTRRAINNPMLAVKVLKEEPGFSQLDDDRIRKLLGKVAWSTLDDNIKMFGLMGGTGLFDDLFNGATRLWYKRHYITERVRAEEARDIEPLKEIQSEQSGFSAPEPGCGPGIMTKELAAAFVSGKAELSEETRRLLDDEEVSLLFRTYSEAGFCVQASADNGNNPWLARDISRDRANAVIDYLAKRYDRRRSQFVLEIATPEESTNDGRTIGYIRLKVIKREGERP